MEVRGITRISTLHQGRGRRTPWTFFAAHTRARVILQLDTSNCRDRRRGSVAVLKEVYPPHAQHSHSKGERGRPRTVIGEVI